MDLLKRNKGYMLIDSLIALLIICILIFVVVHVKQSEMKYYEFFKEHKES